MKIVGLTILGLLILLFLISPLFRRYVLMGMADVYDFNKLPTTKLERCESNFSFNRTSENYNFEGFTYEGTSVDQFDEFLEQNNTNAFIIVKNDTIIYENYFNGHHKESICKIFSITKNVLTTLIGIAIDKGQIESVHDPLIKYIPELRNKGLDKLTIYNCLNGTAGIKYNKNYLPFSDEAKMYYSLNIRELLQNIELEYEPGKLWRTENYSPQLLGWVLERATGTSITNYLHDNLWQPLGLNSGKFVIDSEKNRFEKTESGLVIRPIDLVKFGRLWLNNGSWEGKQIVSEDWIKASTHVKKNEKIQIYWESENMNEYYKQMWWCFSTDNNLTKYSANGHFYQRLVIVPDKNIIVLRLGSAKGDVIWGRCIQQVIEFVD